MTERRQEGRGAGSGAAPTPRPCEAQSSEPAVGSPGLALPLPPARWKSARAVKSRWGLGTSLSPITVCSQRRRPSPPSGTPRERVPAAVGQPSPGLRSLGSGPVLGDAEVLAGTRSRKVRRPEARALTRQTGRGRWGDVGHTAGPCLPVWAHGCCVKGSSCDFVPSHPELTQWCLIRVTGDPCHVLPGSLQGAGPWLK